jgi:ABC-type transport system involved in multi-copper enzyme maturation permease subunit
MKALLLKDFRAYSLFGIGMLIIMFLYSYLNIRFGSVDGIIGLLVVIIPAISGFVLFAGDHALLYFISSLPVSRKRIVLSKYLSTLLFSGFLVLVTIGIIFGLSFFYPDAKSDLIALLTLKGLLFTTIPVTSIIIVSYPLFFKYGLNIAVRIIMFIFALFYGVGIVLIENIAKKMILLERHGIFYTVMKLLEQYESDFGTSIYLIILLLMCLLLCSSITLSIYWFSKKDIV